MPNKRLVVIGASTGGVIALQRLVAKFPSDFPAPVLIVLHTGNYRSILPELLTSKGPLPATHAKHDEALKPGHIYVAPPDYHMLVDGNYIQLNRGPKEHHSRPAVDPLFLSAALNHGPAVIGIILTGRLDDGTPGLQAIKECGGIAIVQDPAEAEEPSMPLSAQRATVIDYCLELDAIPDVCVSLVNTPLEVPAMKSKPDHLLHEQAIALSQGDIFEHLKKIAQPSPFVCPDCTGGLWEVKGSKPLRYRCHTGHAFTLRTLQRAQSEMSDASIWGAIRALQEKEVLLRMVAAESVDETSAKELIIEAQDVKLQADQLRELVI